MASVVNSVLKMSKVEFGEIPRILQQAEQAGKLGRQKILYVTCGNTKFVQHAGKYMITYFDRAKNTI